MADTILFGAMADPPTRGSVLVVDDVPTDAAVITNALRSRGWDAESVQPTACLDRASADVPKLIVLCCDVHNGFSLCLRLKKDPVLRRVPLLLTTAKASPEVIRKHRRLPTRADGYLRKPFDTPALLEALAEVLPDDFRPSTREIGITDIPDRTLVNPNVLETAVVTYVEEEVGQLRDQIARLESERNALTGKITDMEHDLRSGQSRLDSGMKELLEKADRAPSAEVLDAARAEARAAGLAEGLAQGRSEGATERGGAARTAVEGLQAQVEELRGRLKDAEDSAAAARSETVTTTALFERLESGYKNSLEAAEAEKAAADATIDRLEAEAEALRDRVAKLEAGAADLMGLRQRAARAEILEEDCRRLAAECDTARHERDTLKAGWDDVRELSARADALQARVAELEADASRAGAALEQARGDLAHVESERDALRDAAAGASAEAARLRDRFSKLRNLLGEGADA